MSNPTNVNFFTSPEEYVAYMRDATRVCQLQWRKVRRSEARGLTSHSWLEAHCTDGKKLRLETYSDRGYTESLYDPNNQKKSSARFFDPESKIYEGRTAEAHEFGLALTARSLRDLCRSLATSRPYSLTEFNCHHFVLEVWNNVVIDSLKATHYPDRAKTGFLWGLEGALGSWLDGCGSESLGAPHLDQENADAGEGGHVPDVHDPISGSLEACSRYSPTFNKAQRVESFGCALGDGMVHLLELGGPLLPTGMPPRDLKHKSSLSDSWAKLYLPDAGEAAVRLTERIGTADLHSLVAQILKHKPIPPPSRKGIGSQCESLGGFASLGSLRHESAEELLSRGPQVDACFVALRGKELRLAIYAVIQSAQFGFCYLRLLSGDSINEEEACFTYFLWEAEDQVSVMSPLDLARDELQSLHAALSTGDWAFIGLL